MWVALLARCLLPVGERNGVAGGGAGSRGGVGGSGGGDGGSRGAIMRRL